MDKSTIESMKIRGFTYLGEVEGKEVFCNLESQESIQKCLEYLQTLTGEEWGIFKECTGNENLVFYRESLFYINNIRGFKYLRFKGYNYVELPLNCSSCRHMFSDCRFPKDFSLGDKFDTSSIVNMENMFEGCNFPEGFTLGDKFDTSNAVNMRAMFYGCEFPYGFTLGDKFTTFNVTNMAYMFEHCILPEGFALGEKFDTSNVKYMNSMFYNCKIPEDFTLGDKFYTSNVREMNHMFYNCELSEGFTLGDKFDISNVRDMRHMFCRCCLPEGKIENDFSSEKEIVEWLKKPRSNIERIGVF